MKRKFGENIRSKNPTPQVNEILCKLITCNLTVIAHEIFEDGITMSNPGGTLAARSCTSSLRAAFSRRR